MVERQAVAIATPPNQYAKILSVVESQSEPGTADITYEILDTDGIRVIGPFRSIRVTANWQGIDTLSPLEVGTGVYNDAPSVLGNYSYKLRMALTDGRSLETDPVAVTLSNYPPEWPPTGELYNGGWYLDGWLMSDGKLLAATAWLTGEIFDPVSETWSAIAVNGTEGFFNMACKIEGEDKVIFAIESIGSMGSISYDSTTLIYDYSTDSWSQTGSYNKPRVLGKLACLPDGKVALSGGKLSEDREAGNTYNTTSVEIYDPLTGQWAIAASMNNRRAYHEVVVLNDGKLLVIGGTDNLSVLIDPNVENTAEVYDPSVDKWTLTGNLSGSRDLAEAALLADGRVLVAGGSLKRYGYLDSAEIYDPATNLWTATAPMSDRKMFFTMDLMPDGKVIVTGGRFQDETHELVTIKGEDVWINTISSMHILTTAEIYDPSTGLWTKTASIPFKREYHFGVLLADGRFIMGGGWDAGDGSYGDTSYTSAHIYTP